MPDLGGHAATVLGAYGVTLGLIGLLVAASWRQSVAAKRRLAEAEARRGGSDGR
jgi:heme exporter protein D